MTILLIDALCFTLAASFIGLCIAVARIRLLAARVRMLEAFRHKYARQGRDAKGRFVKVRR